MPRHVVFATPASNRNMLIQIKWPAVVAWLCLILLAGCGNLPGSGSTNWQYTALGDSLAVGVLDTQGG